MKKITLLLILTAFLFGCEKDATLNESNDLDSEQIALKKAELTLKHKCWLTAVSDLTIPFTPCVPAEYNVQVPGGGWMKGHETHGGKLIMELSTWAITECYLGPGPTQLTEMVEGTHTVANGSYYHYSGTLTVDFTNGDLTGEIDLLGGSGKYEGVTGHLTISGKQNFETLVATFTGEGFLIFPK